MTIDIDALEARLPEYDPDAPRCPKTVEEVRHYPPFGMEPDDPEYDDFKMVRRVPCCRPEGHEGECRNTRRVLGWPGYATLKELLAEVRKLSTLNERLERKIDGAGLVGMVVLAERERADRAETELRNLKTKSATCSWCGQTVIPGRNNENEENYEEED